MDNKISVKQAVETIVQAMNNDKGFYITWHANVSMAFQDTVRSSGRTDSLWTVANNASHRFFENLGIDKSMINSVKQDESEQLRRSFLNGVNNG